MQSAKAARVFPGGLFICTLLLLAGCATTPQLDALRVHPAAVPKRVELTGVPFFPQKKYQCGPAALATVLNWGGLAASPQSLTPQVYLPKRKGSLQVELLGATRRHGYVPYVIRPQLRDLLAEVAAGHPVIVLQNLGLSWIPQWHYAVVVGYDLDKEQVVLRSGVHRRLIESMPVFERTWARSGYWAMLALPPATLPRTAEEMRYLQAVAGLEQVKQWRAARSSYSRALVRWPNSLTAGMGLGNALYALGDLKGAERAFAMMAQVHPAAGEAFNNLANVLAQQGRLRAAEQAARRAVSLGGSHIDIYRQTLKEVQDRQHGR